MKDYSEICHIVVAAGEGSRFGSTLPKQFLELEGKPVVVRAVEALMQATPGSGMIVVVSGRYESLWRDMAARYGYDDVITVLGGATRYESVSNALGKVGRGVRLISVHDGARPLVTERVVIDAIDRCLSAREGFCGAVPAVAVTDSLRRLDSRGAEKSESVDRSLYVAVQTPQVFPADKLIEAYHKAENEGYGPLLTDDASAIERSFGLVPLLSAGDPDNIKITHPSDLLRAEAVMAGRK